jgi:molybdate transport system ATP-binding protein
MDPEPSVEEIERVAGNLRISHLLNVPLIGLSSGQTRRRRIAASLLTRAKMLILDDPFAGLDVTSRADIGNLLGRVNEETMRTVLVLRGTTEVGMPDWINKVAQVTETEVWTGTREEYVERSKEEGQRTYLSTATPSDRHEELKLENNTDTEREPLIYMKDVNVAYGEKKVRSSD